VVTGVVVNFVVVVVDLVVVDLIVVIGSWVEVYSVAVVLAEDVKGSDVG